MTHGLRFVTRDMVLHGAVPAWSADFDAWAADALARGDIEELASYNTRAPGMPYAHPTPDHYIPLFITLGASGQPDRPVHTTIDGYMMGFAKRSFQTSDGKPHKVNRAAGDEARVWFTPAGPPLQYSRNSPDGRKTPVSSGCGQPRGWAATGY